MKITAPRVHCIVENMATSMMNQIIDEGGEGVILRKPNSLYHRGRTPALVKLKVYFSTCRPSPLEKFLWTKCLFENCSERRQNRIKASKGGKRNEWKIPISFNPLQYPFRSSSFFLRIYSSLFLLVFPHGHGRIRDRLLRR
jgi:hypothetical protein